MRVEAAKNEAIDRVLFTGDLFHGSYAGLRNPEAAHVDITYDYSNYFISYDPSQGDISERLGDGSLTLGPGLYTTTEDFAKEYAFRRAGRVRYPIVHRLSLENVPFFDFRTKEDSERNAHVPKLVAFAWREYFEQHKVLVEQRISEFDSDYSKHLYSLVHSYSNFLDNYLERAKKDERTDFLAGVNREEVEREYPFVRWTDPELGIDLRVKRGLDLRDMLRTYNSDSNPLSPLHGGLWVRFVTQELNCSGVVLGEGGEGSFGGSPSFVIYNPSVIRAQTAEILAPRY